MLACMVYEERIRRGLKRAWLDGNKWIELLALNLMPDPGHHDLSGKSALWRFACPKWLWVNVITGRKHRMNHVTQGSFSFANPVQMDIVYGDKCWRIPFDRVRRLEFRYIAEPDFFYKEESHQP